MYTATFFNAFDKKAELIYSPCSKGIQLLELKITCPSTHQSSVYSLKKISEKKELLLIKMFEKHLGVDLETNIFFNN